MQCVGGTTTPIVAVLGIHQDDRKIGKYAMLWVEPLNSQIQNMCPITEINTWSKNSLSYSEVRSLVQYLELFLPLDFSHKDKKFSFLYPRKSCIRVIQFIFVSMKE